MSKREWRLYAEDILESIELIQHYIKHMEFAEFQQDRKTIDAVVRTLRSSVKPQSISLKKLRKVTKR